MQYESSQAAGPSGWLPSLLPGWTEHVAPNGQLYWHNQHSRQSTYQQAPLVDTASNANERPKKKEAIPGADGWFRVRTNLGNTFYAHKESQRSEWIVPEEIKEQVQVMERAKRQQKEELAQRQREEKAHAEQVRREEQRRKEEQEIKRKEAERMKREGKLRKEQEKEERIQRERLRTLQEVNKRKRENGPEDQSENGISEKKARSSIENSTAAERDEEDEEAWQKRIAAEMAAESEVEDGAAANRELTAEQAKAIFMHMLTEMNGTSSEINPMAPWDKELPKIVDHRDFTVLKELSDKQDAFNEWCRLRLREKRAARMNSKSSQKGDEAAPATSQSDAGDRLAAYRTLLESEVTSTRTHWDDFRKSWKRDRRFFAFGRDEREREKEFRNWLKELGERKRQAAIRNENGFVQLLQEKLGSSSENRLDPSTSTSQAQNLWSQCKKTPGLDSDPRYDAVGSSSRRAVLFEEWAKGKRKIDSLSDTEPNQRKQDDTSTKQVHRDSNDALKQREEEVARQRRLLQGKKTRTLGKALYEEGLTEYRQLLIDAVRDPLTMFENAFDTLSRDDRFHAQALSQNEKQRIFYEHVDNLNRRRLRSLEEVFEKYAPTLDTEREVALPLILDDEEIDRKQLTQLHAIVSGSKTVGDLFDEWQARREQEAHRAFLQMLKENAFVDFWGRLRQEHERKAGDGDKDATTEEGNLTNDEDEDANIPSLLQMAATIDLDEIHAILRDDQRYRAFRHKPRMREEWIREYLQQMKVPKKTVFQR
ncbi:uncharacterized protein FA14DRAFT_117587 [Meira miltonrushii]|uniref:WW domain-containing protein n=1 Tax=Meira miltonrushii TaxID=1280837 RepID=A0A316VIL0_9BASI|nr:uncharacterized protein FA14DRAFT_117587 [Meira miltonrushii]PWN36888.1 hypothetical protein FA14DRAFT_117587 [Meira miltonrushii]